MQFISFMTRLTFVFGLLGLIGAFAARASDRPKWTTSAPRESDGYKFYVGRASSAKTETDAFNEATRDALERAILENFGFRTRVERESFEGMSAVEQTKRAQEVSRDVEVQGFEQVDSYHEESSKGVSAWVLFRYASSEIAREKSRLARAKGAVEKTGSTELGGSQRGAGTLVVTSEPPGARVSIDGEPAGLLATPLTLRDRLKPGKHFVHIDHPSREPADAEVILLPGKTVTVRRVLSPSIAWLRVITVPADANVAVDGKLVGVSPIELKVAAGKTIRVEATHREAGKITQELSLTRNENRTISLELVKRAEHRAGFAPAITPSPEPHRDLYASLASPGIGVFNTDAQLGRPRMPGDGPAFLIGAPALLSRSTLRDVRTPEVMFGASIEYRLLPELGVQLGYARGTAAGVTSQAFRFGLQGIVASHFLIGPDQFAVRGEWGYFFHQISGQYQTTNQQEVGGSLAYGWRATLREDAFYLELMFNAGTRYFYATSGNHQGTLPFVGGAEIALGF